MSREKFHDSINFDQAIIRLKGYLNIKNNRQLADYFQLSDGDFSNRKKSGSILPCIVTLGVHEKINLNWILTGEGDPSEGESPDPERIELLRMTSEILDSKGSFAGSLTANIHSFHEAISTTRALGVMKDEIAEIKKAIRITAGKTRDGDPPEKKGEIIKQRAISSG